MPDMQGTGGVDAREFDLEPFPLSEVQSSVARAAGGDLPDQRLQPLGREPEVHVAADDLDRHRAVRNLDRLGQPARDLLRSLLEDPGELHGGGARVLAALRRLGPSQLEVRKVAVDTDRPRGFSNRPVELLANARGHEQVRCWPVNVTFALLDAPPLA